MRHMRVKEFSAAFNVSRDWIYTEIRSGRLPLVTFCGEPVRPWLIDVEKASGLFSSAQANVIPLASARSLKIEKPVESAIRKRVTQEDLWKD